MCFSSREILLSFQILEVWDAGDKGGGRMMHPENLNFSGDIPCENGCHIACIDCLLDKLELITDLIFSQ